MAGDGSAHTILGLSPGADSAAIDRAYRTLIKRYHPDRDGGDAGRAAEINRAYRELRGPAAKDALVLNDADRFIQRGSGAPCAGAVLALVVASAVLMLFASIPRPGGAVAAVGAAAPFSDPMDAPLGVSAIERGVQEALRLHGRSDEMSMARVSRDCHDRLRRDPAVDLLDRCAAFDDAVVQLQDRDPLRNRGPFSEIAVTGRQWRAAQALSSDNLAIDDRLDRIRLHVELALAPAAVPAEMD
jgi:hypothetical protein